MSVAPVQNATVYNPNNLLDFMMENLKCKNDAALSRALDVAPPVISKIRHNRLPISAALLIKMHELTALPVRELREIMGDRRQNFRLSTIPNHPNRADVIAAAKAAEQEKEAVAA